MVTPMSAATLATIAALLSLAAAVSAYLMRARSGGAPLCDVGELERAVEELVRRLEVTAGRCIHDLESRERKLRRLLADEEPAELQRPREVSDESVRTGTEGIAQTACAGKAAGAPTALYFGSDLFSRAAQACELAERETDEATICRRTGLQRAELRLLLSLRTAQQKAA